MFRLWGSWMQSEASFQIKTLILDHNFSRIFEYGSLVTYKWIAKHYVREVVENPKLSYRAMQDDIREIFLINVSMGQCKRAKQRALFYHEYGLIEQYGRLWDYKEQILATNPGSTCKMDVDEGSNGRTCFKQGELLKAMGKDANNQMFPITWVVVNVENKENWLWFIGLQEAVREWLPMAEHRQCARHIYANLKKKWSAHKWLVERNPNIWCRAFFEMDRCCAAFENGICESYHSAILVAI
ncbi:hypothetical protein Tco_0740905, partial [Tanacetum coccineum]